VRRDHDYRNVRVHLRELFHQLEPGHVRHANVRHEHVGAVPFERSEELPAALEATRDHMRLLERLLEHPADGFVVVDDPNAQTRRRH
jgi:hypothetical protein